MVTTRRTNTRNLRQRRGKTENKFHPKKKKSFHNEFSNAYSLLENINKRRNKKREPTEKTTLTPSLRKATQTALQSIGKVSRITKLRSSHNSVHSKNKNDGDSTHIPQPELPEMPTFIETNSNTREKRKKVSNSWEGSIESDDVSNLFINDDMLSIESTTFKKKSLSLNNMADIYKFFQLPKSINTNIPSNTERNNNPQLKTYNKRKWSGMVNMLSKCIDQLITIICPGPSQDDLRKAIAQRLQPSCNTKDNDNKIEIHQALLHTIFEWIKVSKKGSIEQRILRAIIVKSMKRSMIQRKCNKYELNDVTNGGI